MKSTTAAERAMGGDELAADDLESNEAIASVWTSGGSGRSRPEFRERLDWRSWYQADAADNRRAVAALCSFTTHPLAQAAMAMSREFEGDVRPELVAWHVGLADQYRHIALTFTAYRVIVYAARARIRPNTEAFAFATIDSLEFVRYLGCETTAAQRSRQCGIRKQTFLELRQVGTRLLLEGIRSGLARYLAACEARELLPPTSRHTGFIDIRAEAVNDGHERAA